MQYFDFLSQRKLKIETVIYFILQFISITGTKMFNDGILFNNGILNNIIYGNLDESCFNTLIQHDFTRLHQEQLCSSVLIWITTSLCASIQEKAFNQDITCQ